MSTDESKPPKGFKLAGGPPKTNMFLSLWGEEKTGKTTLALTAPGPIGIIDLNDGLDGVVQKVQAANPGKLIYCPEHRFTSVRPLGLIMGLGDDNGKAVRDYFKPQLDAFISACYELLAAGVRTIILDKATEAWELYRQAFLGGLIEVPQGLYGPPAMEYRNLIYNLRGNCHLILIHGATEVWESAVNPRTGHSMRGPKIKAGEVEVKRKGFGDTGEMVHLEAQCMFTPAGKAAGKVIPPEWEQKITICRANPEIVGQTFEGLDFSSLCQLAVPEYDWLT